MTFKIYCKETDMCHMVHAKNFILFVIAPSYNSAIKFRLINVTECVHVIVS